MYNLIFAIVFGLFTAVSVMPQNVAAQSNSDDFLHFIAKNKLDFLQSRLGLSEDQERDAFLTLYVEFHSEITALSRAHIRAYLALRRELDYGDSPDVMAVRAREAGLFNEKITAVRSGYYDQFAEILGEARFAELVMAEYDFQFELRDLEDKFYLQQQSLVQTDSVLPAGGTTNTDDQ